MTRPGYRSSSFRPHRRDEAAEILNVDYKDVMDQAVINERLRVLREIRKRVEKTPTRRERDSYSYSTTPRGAEEFQRDILAILERLETP